MRRVMIYVGVVCLASLGFLLSATAQFPITIPLTLGEPNMVIGSGSSISREDLDGVIGPEWDDCKRVEMRLGKYSAEILQKRDFTYLYVALIVRTSRRFTRGFEGYVVFDNGDGRDYSRGDDMMLVEAGNGELVDADYYYRGTYDYRLDTRTAGRSNAHGAGKYDSNTGSYVFEFRKELESGDGRDVQLCPGCDFSFVYGWASY